MRAMGGLRAVMRFEYRTVDNCNASGLGRPSLSPRTHAQNYTNRSLIIQTSSNKGYKLLQKMGWSKVEELVEMTDWQGFSLTWGIVEPVQLKIQDHGMSLGIGKATEYDEQAEAATANRRLLLTEKKETAEDVLKEEKKREIVKEIQKVFYCKDCDKQYTNVQQYEEHCNSYDHHHTVRLREMKRLHQQRK
eukprot:1392562-Amorphochlora_amoeboformis.AAC.3